MSQKITVALIMGGKSSEHEVSLQSGKNIFDALNTELYTVILIGIAKDGAWFVMDPEHFLDHADDPSAITLSMRRTPFHFDEYAIDVAFPVIHGATGEDGAIQGVLAMQGIPCVGPSVLASALCYDKDITKKLLTIAGIAVAPSITLRNHEPIPSYPKVSAVLGDILFVKPASEGSSVGVHRITSEKDFIDGVSDAFLYDKKILIESELVGRELECAVLGNTDPDASVIGEVLVSGEHSFYSYDSKYIDQNGSTTIIPADIDPKDRSNLRELAIKAYEALECSGMARIDMFLASDGTITVNEINTIPGFTNISMYPKLWEASELSYPDLLTKLIDLALPSKDSTT